MERFDPKTQIALIWSIADVKGVRPHLTDEQAMDVLHQLENSHCSMGVSWEKITEWADMLYPHPDGAVAYED